MKKNHRRTKLKKAIASVCLGLLLVVLAKGEKILADNDSRWLTPTMINARANMFHPQLNFLIFQNLNKMFATRTVPVGGKVWRLPYSLESIEGKFEFEGRSYGLEEFLEKSATNALLVIKDGQIVHETYRNGSDDTTRFISFYMTKSFTPQAPWAGKRKISPSSRKYLPYWRKGT